MFVLGEDVQKTIGRQVRDQLFERHPSFFFAGDPEPGAGNRVPLLDDGGVQVELTIEFERPRVHGECARSRTRVCRLVDDSD